MKRFIVCADGTWNEPAQAGSESNVVKLARAVKSTDDNGVPQIVYYQKGVGSRGSLWDHLGGGAFGVGISANIQDIYLFLVSNYEPGDELFLFGFSRGAYTARSLAGLIRNSGLLKREYITKYEDAYDLYRDRSSGAHPKSDKAKAFRQQYAFPEFDIKLIGVWDTVGALGVPGRPVWLRFWTKKLYEFHDTDLSSHVNFAYQALAIDEKRKPFQPSIWTKQSGSPAAQVLEQAWFPGVHCDVGGGYATAGLSNGALHWMCNRTGNAGLALDSTLLPTAGDANAALGDSMTWGYRLLGDGTRKLGARRPASSESLHISASQRGNYNPGNLQAFRAQIPPPGVSTP